MPDSSPRSSGPSRTLFMAVLVLEIVFLMAARTPLDTDLWWHLAAGEQTLRSGGPVLTDTFSSTREGSAWINHSWLGEVFLALANRAAGWLGLGALVALLAAASMGLVYKQMKGPPLWRAFLVVPAALVAAPVWSPRPQLFSLLLLALVNELVGLYWRDGRDRLFLLPLLFIAWSNLHGGYPLGLILLGCAIAGPLLDRLLGREDAPEPKKILRLALWTAACLPAVLINPNGIDMWRIPFQTVGVSVLQQAIPEWASPNFHDPVQQPFLILLAGTAATFALLGKPARGEDLLKVIVFGAMGLVARRHFGPFAIVSAPILAASGWQVIQRLSAPPGIFSRIAVLASSKPVRAGVQRTIDMVIVLLLALAGMLKLCAATEPSFVETHLRQTFPAAAVEWIKSNHPEGRLFNEYAWGGYLIWALPEYPVFVDGRTDLYGDEIIGEWLSVVSGGEDWQAILERRQIGLVLVAPGQALEHELVREGWKNLYHDSTAVIYSR
jgi:hypothetical protein